MTEGPVVTVVIPVLNGEQFVGDAIESALAQDHPALEVVVVDDGSTDRSAAVAEAFGPPVRVLRHPENLGLPSARNTAIDAGAGSILVMLDADDRLAPGCVGRHVAHLRDHPDTGVVLGRQEIVLEPGCTTPFWALDPNTGRQLTHAPYSVTVRRAVFDAIGAYDPTYRMSEDLEWLARCYTHGVRVDYLDDVALYRRVHSDNMTARGHADGSITKGMLRVAHAAARRNRKAAGGARG